MDSAAASEESPLVQPKKSRRVGALAVSLILGLLAVTSVRSGGLRAADRAAFFGKSWSRAIERKGPCLYVCTSGSAHACGVGDCACLLPTLGAPRETSGPRIDRI